MLHGHVAATGHGAGKHAVIGVNLALHAALGFVAKGLERLAFHLVLAGRHESDLDARILQGLAHVLMRDVHAHRADHAGRGDISLAALRQKPVAGACSHAVGQAADGLLLAGRANLVAKFLHAEDAAARGAEADQDLAHGFVGHSRIQRAANVFAARAAFAGAKLGCALHDGAEDVDERDAAARALAGAADLGGGFDTFVGFMADVGGHARLARVGPRQHRRVGVHGAGLHGPRGVEREGQEVGEFHDASPFMA